MIFKIQGKILCGWGVFSISSMIQESSGGAVGEGGLSQFMEV